MSLMCASLAFVGMTTPSCLGLSDVDMVFVGGNPDTAASTCDKPNNTLEDCKELFGLACADGSKPTVSQIEWRDARAFNGLILAPWTYTHIFECVAPEKDTK